MRFCYVCEMALFPLRSGSTTALTMNAQHQVPTFHLALTMAGAASAGCYTAGVMDYLFEILDLWEQGKGGKHQQLASHQHLVPMHQVVIDAMGGTSAGGMTTSMAAIYALNGIINPVTKPGEVKEKKDNLFYDSWVLMDDDNKEDHRPLFEKIWDTEDLENGKFESLLNSKFIDAIADRAFTSDKNIPLQQRVNNLPSYISKNLQLLYSHCFLRGMPLEVNFETTISKTGRKSVIPNHTTFEHYIVTQYHLNEGKEPDAEKYLFLNPYEAPHSDTLKLSTKATGAFPVGLIYREFTPTQLGEGYMKTALKRVITGEFGKPDPDPQSKLKLKYFPDKYSSITVDGGAINNEPYREVLSILNEVTAIEEDGYSHKGVVMIDPFPDRAQLTKPYEKPNDVIDVVQNIVGTLTDQSRIKRREMLEADAPGSFRSIVFPRKWKTDANKKPTGQPGTITCAAAMGFGGFLDIKFRQHDFFLGRNNARTFFRYYFSFPYYRDESDPSKNDIHPIHRNWTNEMVEAFKIEKDGAVYLPIIPDMNILIEQATNIRKGPYDYDIADLPMYDPQKLFGIQDQMKKRFSRILKVVQSRDFSAQIQERKEYEMSQLPERQQKMLKEKEQEMNERMAVANEWIEREYSPSLLSRIGSFFSKPFIALGISIGRGIAAKAMTRKAVKAVLNDLAEKGLLKKPE
jgi:hypothetical protein